MPYVIVTVVLLIPIALWMINRSRYYGKMYTDEHYAEVAHWANSVLKKHPVESPAEEDGTTLLTSAGLFIAYTSAMDEGQRAIHFSISQGGGHTTAAVGNRFVFLLLRMLNRNKCTANLFKTQSTVHHVIFHVPHDHILQLEEPAIAVAGMRDYQPFPISIVTVAQPDAAPLASVAA